MNDEDLMRHCLKLAQTAFKDGDAPVGSLIMLDGQILAEGIEAVKLKKDPTAHAEIVAVRAACEKLQSLDLSGATLYTNVEPCLMCGYAIRQTGIRRVVFGVRNNLIGGASSRFDVLIDSGFPANFPVPIIENGVLKIECETIINEFEKLKQLER